MLVFYPFYLQFALNDITGFVAKENKFWGAEYRPKTLYEVTAGVILHKRSLPSVR